MVQAHGPTIELDMLMSFIVSCSSPRVIGHLLVPAELMPEQAQVPAFRIATMSNPPTQEEVVGVQVVSVRFASEYTARDLTSQLRPDDFVGIDDQHPLVPEGEIL